MLSSYDIQIRKEENYMKLIIEESEKKMSESAMHILLGAMMQDKRVNISLTAGRSPKMLYQMMIPEVKNQEKFKNIHYYLFDEAPYQDKKYWQGYFQTAGIPEVQRSLQPQQW